MSGYNIGDEVFSGWKIVRPIGEGGFGRVFEVQKAGHGIAARSALKVVSIPPNDSMVKTALSEGQDEASVAAYFGDIADEFAQEVALVSSLEHPGIVDYKDHEILPREDGMGWDVLLRMELLEPLTERMARGPLPAGEVAKLGAEIADVLAYCHERKVIHRDVKPGNVFVDGEGRCKLGDFGVARTADHTMGALSRKGTEDYMAPEAYRGDPYGAPADVYSLGVMLYQLLNGNRLPFLPPAPAPVGFHERGRARERRLAGEELPPIEGCDAGLLGAVAAACNANPSLRPSAAELRDLLGNLEFPGAQAEPAGGAQEPECPGEAQEGQGPPSQHTKGVWDPFADKEREAAEEEARKRAERERLERERREREERERREKAERERKEKAERERREREERERIEWERAEREKMAPKLNHTPVIIGVVASLLTLVVVGVLVSGGGLVSCGGAEPSPTQHTTASSATDASSSDNTGSDVARNALGLENGKYTATFTTDSSMFKVNETMYGQGVLTVTDEGATIYVALTTDNIVKLFVGTAEDAQKDGAELIDPIPCTVNYKDGSAEEVSAFDIPVPALDEEFNVAIMSARGKWYDHKVMVSDPKPAA